MAHSENYEEEDINITTDDCLTCPKNATDGRIYRSIIDGSNLQYRDGSCVEVPSNTSFEYKGKYYFALSPIGGSGSLELINPNKIIKVPSLIKKGYELIKGKVLLEKFKFFLPQSILLIKDHLTGISIQNQEQEEIILKIDKNQIGNQTQIKKQIKMMKDILKKALKEKFLIGVYLNAEDTSKFTVGYVEKLYEEAVLLSVISPDMITDGFALLNIDLIYLIEYNNTYLINIEKIITKEKEISIPRIDYKRNNKKRLIVDFINFCKKTNKCITVKHNYGFEILGYISNVDDYSLLLDTYTEEGLKNGYTVIRIEEINEIYFGGQSQIKIEILSK